MSIDYSIRLKNRWKFYRTAEQDKDESQEGGPNRAAFLGSKKGLHRAIS
jgi:hypothetical protein